MTGLFLRGLLLALLSAYGCGSGTDLKTEAGGASDGGSDSTTTHDGQLVGQDGQVFADSDAPESDVQRYVVFHNEVSALPDFGWDSGLQPPSSPVQLQLTFSSRGNTEVAAVASPSGSAEAPVLTGLPNGGYIGVHGVIELQGRLVIGITGLPKYDDVIPGLDNIDFAFTGRETFDPYLFDDKVTVVAPMTAVDLPPIPLPNGIPGDLIIELAEGSAIELSFRGTCAAIEGDQAQYRGEINRGGSFVVRPRIEIDIPGIGAQSFPIPDLTVPIELPTERIDLGTRQVVFGAPPKESGERAMVGSCDSRK